MSSFFAEWFLYDVHADRSGIQEATENPGLEGRTRLVREGEDRLQESELSPSPNRS